MTYQCRRIARLLLLGFLIAPSLLMAEDWRSNGASAHSKRVVAFESAAPETTPDSTPTATGNFFSPQWRPWNGPETRGASGSADLRTPLYTDSCFDCPDEACWFLEGGPIALMRERWEGGPFLTKNGHTLLDKDDLESALEWGGRLTAGTRCSDCSEFEITGFVVPNMHMASSGRGLFNVNLPVFNHPFGFDDFATNASLVAVEYSTDMGGFEVLWRRWNLLGCCDPCCGTACSGKTTSVSAGLELGLRYLNVREDFSIYSQAGPLPGPNGFQDFVYRARANNHIVGPEIGLQARSCPWLGFDILFSSRLTLAANFITTDATLGELTGVTAFDKNRDEVSFAQVWDNSIYLRLRATAHLDLRVGYQLLWVNGYAGASDQFSPNLAKPGQLDDNNGALFHGPAMLLQISF
jgi:hypothetical protein